ncbi:MAG: hypothetical protein BWX80_01316 [Candidatus Hydrogenedentes bacterium ADurb.Bin101]|nr:MAG: hypothetical protein BWX80_01316 [Candidatus Hydrogenedentes bacterium ADurb.Bin101]HOC69784.1 DUF4114 domain-containing protein [Candidatus Hydrogenedentota bacterium]
MLPVSLALVLGAWLLFNGSNDAPMQEGHRLHGLPLYQAVQRASSDINAFLFSRFMLPSLVTLANKEYTHSAVASHFEKLALDPARLQLTEESRVRVYFIGEGSGYVNALGVNLKGLGIDEGDPRILFPNANTPLQLDRAAAMMSTRLGRLFRRGLGKRNMDAPLMPGDFIDLGMLPAGAQLNFFLIAFDGQGHNTYSVLKERNPDGIDHMVAMAVEGTSYLLLSFEDMFRGGDSDYEDCVFAVEMSMDNVAALIGKLDPWRRFKQVVKWSVIAAVVFGGPSTVLLIRRRIRRKRLNRAYDAASAALKQSRAREAVKILREVKEQADDKTYIAMSRLEAAALETVRDAAELAALYDEVEEPFTELETASLLAGRAQVEADRIEAFDPLRASWRGRESHSAEWLVLEAEALARRDKSTGALALLEHKSFEGASDALRLARMALLKDHGAEAQALLERALALAPHDPQVLRCLALRQESLGHHDFALDAWKRAVHAAPADPFIRDGVAEFYRRQGRYEAALRLWHGALAPPTLDIIWTKFLFWRRAACPFPADLSTLSSPPGELRPLIGFMRGLPENCFWDPVRFESGAHAHVSLYGRQEVFWLRLLHALQVRNEAEALALVTLSGFGVRSWHPVLERSLARILTYRRSGYMGAGTDLEASCVCVVPVFFEMLEQAAGCAAGEPPPWFMELLDGGNVFAAACIAAGWKAAAQRLEDPGAWPAGMPKFIRGGS